MTYRMECLLICVVVFGGALIGMAAVKLISDRIERMRRKREYYRHLERENAQLKRTVTFYKTQKDIRL